MKLAKYQGNKKESLVPVSRASSPFWPLLRWQREIYRLFGDPFMNWLMPEEAFVEDWMPAINVYEGKDNLVIEAELPGMKKEEIQIYLSGDSLNITGQRREEHEEKDRDTCRAERRFGHFHRTIALPVSIKTDAMEAHYQDGILTVTCPNRKPLEIKVK